MWAAENEFEPATPLSARAADAFQHGDLARAEQLFRSALSSCPQPCIAEPSLRNQLGRVLEDSARQGEAEREYRRVIELNKIRASGSIEAALALNNLGSIEQTRGHWEAADQLQQQAFSILDTNHAVESELGALVLNNIGLYAQKRGRYAEARAAYARSISLLRSTTGEQSEEFAKALKNSALLDFETGGLQDSLKKNTQTLAIENALPSVSFADKALTLNNLGLVLATLERLKPAERAYRESIQLVEGHASLQPMLARTLNNLAMVEKQERRLDLADQHARRALDLAQSQPTAEKTTLASIWNSIGLIALDQNRLSEAETSFERARALWVATVGQSHASYAATLSNLAMVASRRHRHKEAEQLFEQALEIAERNFGASHPQVASGLTNLAAELVHQKRYAEALQNFERAEQIAERSLGADTKTVAELWRDIAISYQGSNDFDSSSIAYAKAVKCLRTAAGSNAPDLAIWLQEYADLLKKRHQFSEAEQAQAESMRIQVQNTLHPS
jgi:tetratricopeptide (TPR) repeat protein